MTAAAAAAAFVAGGTVQITNALVDIGIVMTDSAVIFEAPVRGFPVTSVHSLLKTLQIGHGTLGMAVVVLADSPVTEPQQAAAGIPLVRIPGNQTAVHRRTR
jgi:hypothetical protein